MKKTGKRMICVSVIILLLVCLFLGIRIARVWYYPASDQRQALVEELQENYYSCFKLSLLPTEDFSHGDIEFFTGMATLEADYLFCNLKDVGDFLEEVYATQEEVKEIYLYLDPVEISGAYGNIARFYGEAYSEYLLDVMSRHPETFFGFVLPNYSIEYWRGLDDGERLEAQTCIKDFRNLTALCENAKVYFMGFEDWLVGNSANYVDERMHNEDVHSFLIALMLWRDEYVLTGENFAERFGLVEQMVRNVEIHEKTDLSKYDLIFFGDSVIGNYTDSLSIPGAVQGLTGARVYNLGNGGSMASEDEKLELYFGSMVVRFLKGDVKDLEECTFKEGVERYYEDGHAGRTQCFVINYGLNDFFRSRPVDNPDNPLDIGTYGGALRSGLEKLKEAYPEAIFVLSGPNLITAYENGTRISEPSGGVLEEYADIARKVAEAYGGLYFDTYHDTCYTLEQAGIYLADGYHPNHRGRFLLAQRFVEAFGAFIR